MTGIDQPSEILERAELRVHGVVPAVLIADGIKAARIVRAGAQGIVAALAIGAADRMDRREIEHVKAERGDFRQPRDAVVEGAMLARGGALAGRPPLVPGPGARAWPLGEQRYDVGAGDVRPRLGLLDGSGQRIVE